jgi:hypothetical protein
MNREDLVNLTIEAAQGRDLPSGKPNLFRVVGLPSHLTAEIKGNKANGYKYLLERNKQNYEPTEPSRSPELALEALKKLLTWEPV